MENKCYLQHFRVGKSLWTFSKKIPLAMRLFILCLFCSIGLMQAAGTYAQNARISLNAEAETVANVLKQIEEASDFSFFYNNTLLDLDRLVSISAENEDIFSILDEVFAGTNVRYTVMDQKSFFPISLRARSSKATPSKVRWSMPRGYPSSVPASDRQAPPTVSSPTWTATSS